MGVTVIADAGSREELCGGKDPESFGVKWIVEPSELPVTSEVIIDLLFEPAPERIKALRRGSGTVIINSVVHKLAGIDPEFVRINGWKTFLKGEVIEASATKKEAAERIFSVFGKKLEWLPDEIGFITPKVISMIINEAYFALEEKVSTKEEIDTAMKLGTNYPFGPFEWAEKIGIENIRELLEALAKENPRYKPAPGLSNA